MQVCRHCEAGFCTDLSEADEAEIREVAFTRRVSARKAMEIIARDRAERQKAAA